MRTAAATSCCVDSSPTTNTSGWCCCATCSISVDCWDLSGTGMHCATPMCGVGGSAKPATRTEGKHAISDLRPRACQGAGCHTGTASANMCMPYACAPSIAVICTELAAVPRPRSQQVYQEAHPCRAMDRLLLAVPRNRWWLCGWDQHPPASAPVVSSSMTLRPRPPWSGLLLIRRATSRRKDALPEPGRPNTSSDAGLHSKVKTAYTHDRQPWTGFLMALDTPCATVCSNSDVLCTKHLSRYSSCCKM
jgi:hypothetical protein